MPTAAYIGIPSRLLPLEHITGLSVTQEGRYSVQSAGSRTWAFATRPATSPPPRTWDVALVAGNASLATLQGMAGGAFGNQALCWLPEAAYLTNVLTPRQASLADQSGGWVEAVDGWSPRSSLGPTVATLAAGVPILPGQPVTVSVDASGATILRAVFRNASGSIVQTREARPTDAAMQRLSVSVPSAPTAARTVDVQVSGHTAATRPQVTWSRRPTPWASGAGANSVVIEELDWSQRHLDARLGLLMDVQVKLREVD